MQQKDMVSHVTQNPIWTTWLILSPPNSYSTPQGVMSTTEPLGVRIQGGVQITPLPEDPSGAH